MSVTEDLQEQLEKILMTMEDRGFKTYMVGLNRTEIQEILDMISIVTDKKQMMIDDEYAAGYQYGYKSALLDAVRKLREMEWHGGNKQEKRAAGMP